MKEAVLSKVPVKLRKVENHKSFMWDCFGSSFQPKGTPGGFKILGLSPWHLQMQRRHEMVTPKGKRSMIVELIAT